MPRGSTNLKSGPGCQPISSLIHNPMLVIIDSFGGTVAVTVVVHYADQCYAVC